MYNVEFKFQVVKIQVFWKIYSLINTCSKLRFLSWGFINQLRCFFNQPKTLILSKIITDMETIINCTGKETLIFAKTIESEAYNQIKKLVNSEAYRDAKVRIMPDAHAGKGCTVGTTMTISGKVTPNLVGVDIGCGMLTLRLSDRKIDFAKLDSVIKSNVPSGFNVHKKSVKDFDFSGLRCKKHVDSERAMVSIGSLGGGNHFIEAGKNKEGEMFLIIHSGSRKPGTDVCKYYQDKAIRDSGEKSKTVTELIERLKTLGREKEIATEMKKMKKSVTDRELAFLTGLGFDDYMNDMAIIQKYATLNRETIAEIILKEAGLHEAGRFETIHNYIDFKRMILRKGAVSAEKGEILIIPINMRDGSLLCTGKGNENWNYSAPHGAGRLMSRKNAKKTLKMKDFINSMNDVYTTSVAPGTLDEAPQAYKPMREIMSAITDTVDIIDVIKPVYNFKAQDRNYTLNGLN